MNKFSIALASLGLAAGLVPAVASAAPWQNINQRQANLYQRIDQGIRAGQLNRNEAARLKTDYRGLVNLEARYRRGGLNNWERADLNRRFDVLSQRVRFEKNDRQGRRR